MRQLDKTCNPSSWISAVLGTDLRKKKKNFETKILRFDLRAFEALLKTGCQRPSVETRKVFLYKYPFCRLAGPIGSTPDASTAVGFVRTQTSYTFAASLLMNVYGSHWVCLVPNPKAPNGYDEAKVKYEQSLMNVHLNRHLDALGRHLLAKKIAHE